MAKSQDKIFSIRDFSDNAEKYNLLKTFWHQNIKDIIGIEPSPYVDNYYSNGEEILDGNPIFSTLLDEKKSLRVIQNERDNEEAVFTAWTNQIFLNDKKIHELVISLQLTPETFFETKYLIKLFGLGALSKEILKSVNEKYELISGLNQLTHAFKAVDSIDSLPVFSNWHTHHVSIQKFHIVEIKRFSEHYETEKHPLHNISFIGKSTLYKTYSKFLKNMDFIYAMVNVDNFDFENESPQKFQDIVVGHYGSLDKYVFEIKKSSTLAEKQFEEIKDKLQLYDFEG